MEFSVSVHHFIISIVNTENIIQVEKSWINQGNLGLFSKKYFRKGDIIGKYAGEVLNTVEALRRSEYYLTRYINDCRNSDGYNVYFLKSSSELCAWVLALKDITINEELFVDYGKWYWVRYKPAKLSTFYLNKRKQQLQE